METISQQPGDPDRILIGYTRGLLVLWNRKSLSADQVIELINSIHSKHFLYEVIVKQFVTYQMMCICERYFKRVKILNVPELF